MAKHRKVVSDEPSFEDRAMEFLQDCDQVYRYLYGLADGLESAGDERYKAAIHRIRCGANELSDGVMFVRHGYREQRERK